MERCRGDDGVAMRCDAMIAGNASVLPRQPLHRDLAWSFPILAWDWEPNGAGLVGPDCWLGTEFICPGCWPAGWVWRGWGQFAGREMEGLGVSFSFAFANSAFLGRLSVLGGLVGRSVGW